MTYGSALAALADPTRRTVFERLGSGPKPVAEIAKGLTVSRPAVSQHLKVLKEAGLVSDRPEGTRRIYYIDPNGLGALRAWLDRFWDEALENFRIEAEERSVGNAWSRTPSFELNRFRHGPNRPAARPVHPRSRLPPARLARRQPSERPRRRRGDRGRCPWVPSSPSP